MYKLCKASFRGRPSTNRGTGKQGEPLWRQRKDEREDEKSQGPRETIKDVHGSFPFPGLLTPGDLVVHFSSEFPWLKGF